MAASSSGEKSTRIRKKIVELNVPSRNKEKNLSIKKVSVILQKSAEDRTAEEKEFLRNSHELAEEATSRMERRQVLKQRLQEFEDTDEELDTKCRELADALAQCQYLVVYTGAGISTAARIPDYRGTSGIWTLLQQGKDIGSHDLTQAEPTYTHMAISALYKQGKVRHVVSQNCDGLHLRSGLPKSVLSEVHGNMYIEVCRQCRPIVEYLRLFDVTENTARFNHRTYRRCYKCNNPLVDSIVHFGERGNLPWPLHWKGACRAAEQADVILCIGSSLKVLKRYPWLWAMDRPAKRRPKLFIVNLQWTPKDCHALLKIHGKCDAVMRRVMKHLSIEVPDYDRKNDPIFAHATPLCLDEQHTTERPHLHPFMTEKTLTPTTEPPSHQKLLSSSPSVTDPSESPIPSKSPLDFSSPPTLALPQESTLATKLESPIDPMLLPHSSLTAKSPSDSLILLKRDDDSLSTSIKTRDEEQLIVITVKPDMETNADSNLQSTDNVDIPVIFAPPSPPEAAFNPYLLEAMFYNYFNLLINTLTMPSIVEPVPESSSSLKRQSDNNSVDALEKKVKLTECDFCQDRFDSQTCLFYKRRHNVFTTDDKKCVCCDDDDDENENDEENVEDDVDIDENDEDKVVDKVCEKTPINPGWYGKGCRKKVKKKR